MRRVVVIGSATVDEIRRTGTSVTKMGGVVTYTGITFQKHGFNTCVVSNIAAEDEELFRILREQSIQLFNGVTDRTTVFVNYVNGDQRRQEMPVRASPITAEQARHAVESADHIHLGPLHPSDIQGDLLTLVAQKKVWVTLDVQGLVRRIDNGQVHIGISERLHPALLCSSLIKADRTELQAILDSQRMGIEDLMKVYELDEVVVTAGREGGRVTTASGEVVGYKAARVSQVVDTTGAGDVFFGAYLCSRLHERRSILESCEHAALVAAQQVSDRYITQERLRVVR